jgi:hypothetical protein
MVPALTPISPKTFKDLLIKYGYKLELETPLNWSLYRENAPVPIIHVPKRGDVISVAVMMGVLERLKIDNAEYFRLLQNISN